MSPFQEAPEEDDKEEDGVSLSHAEQEMIIFCWQVSLLSAYISNLHLPPSSHTTVKSPQDDKEFVPRIVPCRLSAACEVNEVVMIRR